MVNIKIFFFNKRVQKLAEYGLDTKKHYIHLWDPSGKMGIQGIDCLRNVSKFPVRGEGMVS